MVGCKRRLVLIVAKHKNGLRNGARIRSLVQAVVDRTEDAGLIVVQVLHHPLADSTEIL